MLDLTLRIDHPMKFGLAINCLTLWCGHGNRKGVWVKEEQEGCIILLHRSFFIFGEDFEARIGVVMIMVLLLKEKAVDIYLLFG